MHVIEWRRERNYRDSSPGTMQRYTDAIFQSGVGCLVHQLALSAAEGASDSEPIPEEGYRNTWSVSHDRINSAISAFSIASLPLRGVIERHSWMGPMEQSKRFVVG